MKDDKLFFATTPSEKGCSLNNLISSKVQSKLNIVNQTSEKISTRIEVKRSTTPKINCGERNNKRSVRERQIKKSESSDHINPIPQPPKESEYGLGKSNTCLDIPNLVAFGKNQPLSPKKLSTKAKESLSRVQKVQQAKSLAVLTGNNNKNDVEKDSPPSPISAGLRKNPSSQNNVKVVARIRPLNKYEQVTML